MGFFASKCLSSIWSLLKNYEKVPKNLPSEKAFAMAFLAALIGFISVKNGKFAAQKKIKAQMDSKSEQ